MKQSDFNTSLSVAVEFVCEVINTAMVRFNVDFDTIDKALSASGYWDLFDNIEVTCVGAHDGVEPVLEEIKGYL